MPGRPRLSRLGVKPGLSSPEVSEEGAKRVMVWIWQC
jgi:hypothetical protein